MLDNTGHEKNVSILAVGYVLWLIGPTEKKLAQKRARAVGSLKGSTEQEENVKRPTVGYATKRSSERGRWQIGC